MRRSFVPIIAALVFFAGSATSASAQAQPLAPSFSNKVLATYGLPEIQITQRADGFDAPSAVAAGRYLVALTSAKGFSAYLDLVKVPAGLAETEAGSQLLSAARNDTPVAGWTYGGGTYAIDGRTAWVVFDLAPGQWTWGLTSQPSAQNAEETPYLLPLTVTPPQDNRS
jgi:hypothetical protein